MAETKESTRDLARGVVLDARAYVRKHAESTTSNLAEFRDFVLVVTGEDVAKFSAKERAAFEAGIRAAGLYSRYQAANRAKLLPAILALGKSEAASRARGGKTGGAKPGPIPPTSTSEALTGSDS